MNSLMKNEISQWRDNLKDDFLGGLVSAFSVIPEVVGFTIIAGVNPMLGLYTSVAFLILSAFLGGRPAMVSAGAGSMALVVVALIAEYGTEYLFAAVFLAGIFQLIMGLCKVGRLIKYIPQCVMTGFVDSLAIIIFMSQIKNALGGGLTMYALVAAGIVIVYLFPRITKAVPSTLIAIIVVTAASVFLGLTTTSIGDMGNMTAALPDVHLPTLLLSLETWKIVLPYSISLAFVGLIETLLTQQVVDQMTETTSDTNRESCSSGHHQYGVRLHRRHAGLCHDRTSHRQRQVGRPGPSQHAGGGRHAHRSAGLWQRAAQHHSAGGAHRGNDHRVHRDLRLGFAPFPQGSVAAGDFRRRC